MNAQVGEVFGDRVVISEVTQNRCWRVRCVCGKEQWIASYALRNGLSDRCKSCGKFRKPPNTTHGLTYVNGTLRSEYIVWQSMRKRAGKDKGYEHAVCCLAWSSFETFFQDMGTRPTPQHSLDRIDNSKGYCANNCRWATPEEQARNTRRNINVCVGGVTKCLAEWCELLELPYGRVNARTSGNFSPLQALTAPRLPSRIAGMLWRKEHDDLACERLLLDSLFQIPETAARL